MDSTFIPEYRRVRRSGWDIQKQPAARFNANGCSESYGHYAAKAVGLKLCLEHGYHADTEVVHEEQGEIDLLAIAPDKISYAIEFETNPEPETITTKRIQYVESTPVIDDMLLLDLGELPIHLQDLRDSLKTGFGFVG